jgi:hypothetical protein
VSDSLETDHTIVVTIPATCTYRLQALNGDLTLVWDDRLPFEVRAFYVVTHKGYRTPVPLVASQPWVFARDLLREVVTAEPVKGDTVPETAAGDGAVRIILEADAHPRLLFKFAVEQSAERAIIVCDPEKVAIFTAALYTALPDSEVDTAVDDWLKELDL